MNEIAVFSGSAHPELAAEICAHLQAPLLPSVLHRFANTGAICNALQEAGYSTGAMVIDASLFVPHTRPRLFIVCPRQGASFPAACINRSSTR